MICTVTFNPSLDYIVSVDDFQLGMTNRTSSELILPHGADQAGGACVRACHLQLVF